MGEVAGPPQREAGEETASGGAEPRPPAATGAESTGDGDTAPRTPRVLVIVVNWNGLEVTTRCLESLAALTYPAYEILVVDNASTDGSADELGRRFPDVDMVRCAENRLYAGGANLGLRQVLSRGCDYGLLLNNDTTAAPDLIERLVEVAEAGERVGLVGPKIYYDEPPDLIWSAGGRIEWWRGMSHHIGLRQPDGARFDEEREVDYLTGCCLLAHRRVIVDVGYLDTGFHMYSEDADWCARARALGFRVRFAPAAHLWHQVSASSGGGLTAYKMYHRVHSNLMFLRRHARPYHWLTIPFALPFEFLRMALRETARGNRGVVAAGFRALFDLARRSPRRAP